MSRVWANAANAVYSLLMTLISTGQTVYFRAMSHRSHNRDSICRAKVTCHSFASIDGLLSRLKLVPQAMLLAALLFCIVGCKKKAVEQAPPAPVVEAQPGQGPPGPALTPTTPQMIDADAGNIDATLADLTRKLHRTMIGRRLNGTFEEF